MYYFFECARMLFYFVADPKEVKVFVEMMSIAAGEYDYEVDRVACFEASCLAFSPMIFELEIESGFTELYSACEKTAKSLSEDPKIIEKLVCLIFQIFFTSYYHVVYFCARYCDFRNDYI